MKSLKELTQVFGHIGLLSFGGPAAQIALMHKELVETRDWLTEAQFLRALSFCMLLPGPEAMQLATYAGWKQRGIVGGLIGGGLFVIPGAIVIGVLALVYGAFGEVSWIQALFLGIKATVVVIVLEALIKVSKRALKGRKYYVIAALSFTALFFFAVPFPIVIAIAALIGAIGTQVTTPPTQTRLPWAQSGKIIGVGLILWAIPILIAFALSQDLLVEIGLFFSKLAVVTFGGAYAVLAYMTQAVVNTNEWLTTAQMMDALGLAETTPGPLILVTQFVAMLTGFAQGGVWTAVLAGMLALWVTFVPCFIWIFAGAPLIDWLEGRPKLNGALAAITGAVVGVIANLTIWFALHVFFGRVVPIQFGPLSTILPDLATLQVIPLGLAALAAVLLLKRHWGLSWVLMICSGVSLLIASL
ncbi:MAG: chromate efflux transporter [Loktanella sp.]|jgi:chromate transporter|nr:chromate efflux transporter [Loktanella sp.]MDO7608156.1 chromate efflux transporter [Loktanella sp.]MDO7624416.1 chromate efflux transporter [Loktanella sp.]MDO7626688.1 chromate efflux transporter [Loktanella sp.]MDO7629780.1 chromate efflux transporter [Loktanella sp.]